MQEGGTTLKGRANRRRLVALFTHAPGLWIFFRERLPAHLLKDNLWALLGTLLAMLAPFAIPAFRERAGWLALIAWLLGHFAWGVYLAVRLPDER